MKTIQYYKVTVQAVAVDGQSITCSKAWSPRQLQAFGVGATALIADEAREQFVRVREIAEGDQS